MGVDASVFCDCCEKETWRVPPPEGLRIRIDDDGAPMPDFGEHMSSAAEDQQWDVFTHWMILAAPCPHEDFKLVSRRLGNISLMSWLGKAFTRLERELETGFPVILEQVISNGCHAGGMLALEDVARLRHELERLRTLPEALDRWWPRRETDRAHLETFLKSLEALVDAALRVHKPISF